MLQKPTVNPTINARKVRSMAGGGATRLLLWKIYLQGCEDVTFRLILELVLFSL